MQVTVELFGIPRARAGVAQTVVSGETLGEVLLALAQRYPALSETCLDGAQLRDGYIVNLGGQRFVRDPLTSLSPGDVILLLSQDSGG